MIESILKHEELLSYFMQAFYDKYPPVCLPDDLRTEESDQLYRDLLQLRHFLLSIASGDLSQSLEVKGFLAGALKTLQANLKHMTWQTKRIAAGDFVHSVVDMGEFSTSFKIMTERLQEAIQTVKTREIELNIINNGLLLEIERRKKIQDQLAESEAHYRSLTETMKDVVWVADIPAMSFTYISPSITSVIGYTPEELKQMRISSLLAQHSADFLEGLFEKRCQEFIEGSLDLDNYYTAEVEVLRKGGGQTVWLEAVSRYVPNEKTGSLELHTCARDITDRRALEKELYRQATTDALTKVANRRHLLSCLEKEMLRSDRHGHPLCYLILDIDHFKRVNDTHGHGMGDKALQALAAECRDLSRGSDCFGRLGGEEFASFLVDTTLSQAGLLAERLREKIASLELTTDDGVSVPLRISIGVTQYQPGTDTVSSLMTRADQSFYRAKLTGRNRVIMV